MAKVISLLQDMEFRKYDIGHDQTYRDGGILRRRVYYYRTTCSKEKGRTPSSQAIGIANGHG